MQPDKATNKISDLEVLTSDSEKLISSLTDVMNKFKIRDHSVMFDFLKSKGFAISSLVSILIILPFYGIASVAQLMRCGIKQLDIKGKKDAFYDVKNNEFIDWRKLLILHARRFKYLLTNNINKNSDKITAIIFDDTKIEKTGKKIEKVGLMHDHVTNTFVFGYKLLVCGFWDGDSFIPLDFTLHREKGNKQEKVIKEYHKSIQVFGKQDVIHYELQKKHLETQTKLAKQTTKLQIKSTKINELTCKKTEEKLKTLNAQLTESQKVLLKYQLQKNNAYKNLKHHYSTECLYGLTAKERKEQYKKPVSTNSHGFTRRKEANKNKIDCMLEMLCRVVKLGFIPQYVLVDSWFFCFELLEKLSELKKGSIKLVSMVKINNQKFTICLNNKCMPLKNILKTHERNLQKCKKLKSEYIKVTCLYKGIRTNLFFVRMGKCKTWHLLATTDLTLNFIKLMEIYQIRWSIEIFFKESKQYLHIGACQSNTFDAQIASITITMMQHIMLSYFKRKNYQQSIGGLFENLKRELIEIDIVTRLIDLFWELVELLCTAAGIDFIEFQKDAIKNDEIMSKFKQLIPEKVLEKAT
jgi:hypothetical protein